MPGTVEASEFLGEFTRYRVRIGPHELSVDEPHRAGQTRFKAGTAVSLGLDVSQLRLFAA